MTTKNELKLDDLTLRCFGISFKLITGRVQHWSQDGNIEVHSLGEDYNLRFNNIYINITEKEAFQIVDFINKPIIEVND